MITIIIVQYSRKPVIFLPTYRSSLRAYGTKTRGSEVVPLMEISDRLAALENTDELSDPHRHLSKSPHRDNDRLRCDVPQMVD